MNPPGATFAAKGPSSGAYDPKRQAGFENILKMKWTTKIFLYQLKDIIENRAFSCLFLLSLSTSQLLRRSFGTNQQNPKSTPSPFRPVVTTQGPKAAVPRAALFSQLYDRATFWCLGVRPWERFRHGKTRSSFWATLFFN